MTQTDLTINDRSRLRDDIKLSLIIGLIFSVALVILVVLIPVTLFLFGKSPSGGFLTRGLYILGLLFSSVSRRFLEKLIEVYRLSKREKSKTEICRV